MAIKKYFVASFPVGVDCPPRYGAADLNKIVGCLRTTGIYGGIADCLKVSGGPNWTATVNEGIGWVDGCGIEVPAGSTGQVTLTEGPGSYAILMRLVKNGDTVSDIRLDFQKYDASPPEGDHILALVTAAADGTVTAPPEGDKRKISVFRGLTNYPYNIYSGTATYTDAVTTAAPVVKAISVPPECKRLRVHIRNRNYSDGLLFETGTEGIDLAYGPLVASGSREFVIRAGALKTDGTTGGYFTNKFGYAVCGPAEIYIDSASFAGGVFTLQFKTLANASLNCTISWEAW